MDGSNEPPITPSLRTPRLLVLRVARSALLSVSCQHSHVCFGPSRARASTTWLPPWSSRLSKPEIYPQAHQPVEGAFHGHRGGGRFAYTIQVLQ